MLAAVLAASRFPATPLLLGWLALCWGCLGDEFPPTFAPTPATCGNGTCDLGDEDCINCPSDCSCCNAVSSAASSNVTDEAAILGAPDGKEATLNAFSSIVLVIGREIFNSPGTTQGDFPLVGTVTSDSQAQSVQCASASTGLGAFEVSASFDGSDYRFVGFWSKQNKSFDIGCAQLKSARFIRIEGQPAAAGTLDALTGEACLQGP